MIDEKIESILKIADTHVKHLQDAVNDMAKNYPFTETFITNMSKDDLRTLDTMTGRFGKLQDLIGSKIIDIYLVGVSESITGKSILDKVNKLEKLYILEDANIWTILRDIRNHIAHEYPDNPKLAAEHLNNVYKYSAELIAIYNKLSMEIQKL